MYDIQNWYIPDKIDFVLLHKQQFIQQNIDVSMFKILSVKKPHIWENYIYLLVLH